MKKLLSALIITLLLISNNVLAEPIKIDESKEIYAKCRISGSKTIVNESIVYTLSIYSMVNLAGLEIDELNIPNTTITMLDGATSEKIKVNNLDYMLHKIEYSIVPDRNGVYKIPSLSLIATVKNDAYASELIRGKEIILFTKEKEFTVE